MSVLRAKDGKRWKKKKEKKDTMGWGAWEIFSGELEMVWATLPESRPSLRELATQS